eukprot:scaffold1102_cov395-Prasinococcus_capsulatus_cf.AAC.5
MTVSSRMTFLTHSIALAWQFVRSGRSVGPKAFRGSTSASATVTAIPSLHNLSSTRTFPLTGVHRADIKGVGVRAPLRRDIHALVATASWIRWHGWHDHILLLVLRRNRALVMIRTTRGIALVVHDAVFVSVAAGTNHHLFQGRHI